VALTTSGVQQRSIWPDVVSDDAPGLRDWLLALGFTIDLQLPGEGGGAIHHAQLDWPDGGRIALSSSGERETPCRPGTSWQHVVCCDPDAVWARARALGARVVDPIRDMTDYPSREFTIADGDGNYWTFATFAG
jgi:uncharacterized glyoxalase superfamily protein PhnB